MSRSHSIISLSLLSIGLVAPQASAQTHSWSTSFPSPAPLIRERCFNGTDGNISYLYGGQWGAGHDNRDDFWTWDGTTYTQVTLPGAAPGKRAGGASCWDAARGKFVLFSGRDFTTSTQWSDGWEWDSVNGWVQMPATVPFPSARWLIGDSSEYVPGLGLVFHGGNVGGTKSNETWAYDGTAWTMLSAAGPDRQQCSMVYRPTTHDLIVYGGQSNAGGTVRLDETWKYDIGTSVWTQITTATNPSAPGSTSDGLMNHSGYFNPATNKVVIYGGMGNGGQRSHLTWEFDGTDWTDATDPGQSTLDNVTNGNANWVNGSLSAVILCGNRSNGAANFVLEHGPFTSTNPGTSYCLGDGSGSPCPCGNFGGTGEGCANSGGTGAILSGTGLTGTGAGDTLVLDIAGVPGAKPGLLLRGDNQIAALVGGGLLCVGANTQRSQVQVTDASGATTFSDWNGSGFESIANSGVPTQLQFWYRDPGGVPCAGTDFNFTNGYSVTYP
jgi:hypothetical protein